MKKYSHTYSVILDNMDLNEYRLRPISAIMYVQDAFARYTATKNMAAYDLFPNNIYWVVGDFNIDFIERLPFWSEEIRVEVWFSEVSKLKIYTDFNIYCNDILFSKGNACWFLLDLETKRPTKTDEIKDKFNICSEFTIGKHKKFILTELRENVSKTTHKINLSDIDFNNHVNNKCYINIAEMAMDKDFRNSHFMKSMKIKFIKETFMDDSLVCYTYKTDLPFVFVNKIKKDETVICEVQTSWEPIRNFVNISDADLKIKNE